MKLGWITVQVNNMEESIKFYNEILNLKVNDRFKKGEMELAYIDVSGAEIELMYHHRNQVTDINKGISIGLEIDDMDSWIKRLESYDFAIDRDGIVKLEMMSYFFIKDPNGLNIQLYEMSK